MKEGEVTVKDEKQICPMSVASSGDCFMECKKEECAWWLPLENCCAVKRIGEGADK